VVTPDREWPHRWTFYIDKEGVIRHIDTSVKPGTAGADLAARLAELKM
jgi:peroxiredoxin Q/BCP